MTDRSSSGWLIAVDAGLLLAVFAVPFAFGGRHSIGETLLIVAAIWSTLTWSVFQMSSPEPVWFRTRAELCLLAVLAVGLLQIVNLPATVLDILSPATREVLPAFSEASDPGLFAAQWPHLSLSISESIPKFAVGIAYVLLFYVTAQRIRSVSDAGRILKWIACSGTAMAFFGFIQFFFSNGLYYWVLDLPQGTMSDRLKGAFLNKNHFAQFVALSIGPLMWWFVSHSETHDVRTRQFGHSKSTFVPRSVVTGLLIIAIGLVVTAVAVSRARGAFVSVAVSAGIMLLILYARSLITRRQMSMIAGSGVVMLLLMLVLGQQELGRVAERLENWDNNGRFEIWTANVEVFKEFPIAGAGIGSHLDIHQRHLDRPFSVGQYSHAESSYLQIATETGLIGLAVLVACLACCFYWSGFGLKISQDRQAILILCATLCSLMISCLQSVTDFVWYVPGCMVPIILQMACACRVFKLEGIRLLPAENSCEFRLPRPVFAAIALAVLPLGSWMISQWWPRLQADPYWTNYRKIILADKTGKDISADLSTSDGSRWPVLRQALRDLRKAVRLNPNDSRVHSRLAVQYTRLFHLLQRNSDAALPLNQIRDAAINGGFDSQQELHEWLARAFGNNIRYAVAAAKHARRAIELNPIDGIAWLYLSELSFLLDASPGLDRQCLAQSLNLRPYNAQVLYAAGRDARLDGNVEEWVDYWKLAFQRDEDIQLEIIQSMAEWTPAPVEIVVKAFDPDIDAVERMIGVLKTLDQEDNRQKAIAVLAQLLSDRAKQESNQNRADDWRRAAIAYAQLGLVNQVESSFEAAVTSAPSNFRIHLEYGTWLLNQGRHSESIKHLQWCERIAPHNARVQQLLVEISRRFRQKDHIRQVSATVSPATSDQ